jgi:hypothetical protein
MDAARQNRLERLRKLAAALNEKIEDPKTLLERVDGLREAEEDFRKFSQGYNDEDSALDAFIQELHADERRIRAVATKKELKNPIPLERFRDFARSYLDNLRQVEIKLTDGRERIKDYEPLSLDDLWEGLLAYGRFRERKYIKWEKENMPEGMWKKGKRAQGSLKLISKMTSPSDLLEIKQWSDGVEKRLMRHRDFFDAFATGYLQGHWNGYEHWRRKTSVCLDSNDLRKLIDSLHGDAFAHQCTVSFDASHGPRFHGISLPAYSQWQLANAANDEDGRQKWAKLVRKLEPPEKR